MFIMFTLYSFTHSKPQFQPIQACNSNVETKKKRSVSFADTNQVFAIPLDLHRKNSKEHCSIWNVGDQNMQYVSKPSALAQFFGQRATVDKSRVLPLTARPSKLVKMKVCRSATEVVYEIAAENDDESCSRLDPEPSCVLSAFGSGFKLDAKGRTVRFSRRLASKAWGVGVLVEWAASVCTFIRKCIRPGLVGKPTSVETRSRRSIFSLEVDCWNWLIGWLLIGVGVTVLRLGYYYPGGNRSALLHLLTTALEVRGALRALLFLLPTGVLKRSASCATLSFCFC